MNDILRVVPSAAASQNFQHKMLEEQKPRSKDGSSDFEKLLSEALQKGNH